MTITAEQGDVAALAISPASLEQRLARAYELLYEQVQKAASARSIVGLFGAGMMR